MNKYKNKRITKTFTNSWTPVIILLKKSNLLPDLKIFVKLLKYLSLSDPLKDLYSDLMALYVRFETGSSFWKLMIDFIFFDILLFTID